MRIEFLLSFFVFFLNENNFCFFSHTHTHVTHWSRWETIAEHFEKFKLEMATITLISVVFNTQHFPFIITNSAMHYYYIIVLRVCTFSNFLFHMNSKFKLMWNESLEEKNYIFNSKVNVKTAEAASTTSIIVAAPFHLAINQTQIECLRNESTAKTACR